MSRSLRERRLLSVILTLLVGSIGCDKPSGRGARDAERPTVDPASAIELRVLTFNAFAVPFRSGHDSALAQVAPAVAALGVDVVAMQEVWRADDAQHLAEGLAAEGLTHQRWYSTDAMLSYGSAGLLVASSHPIASDDYRPFTTGTLPFLPWHPDWFAGKGLARVDIETPVGMVRFATTHIHAAYETFGYEPVRTGQMLEILEGLNPWDEPLPLILAGDLNASHGELPFRVLAEGGGFSAALHDDSIDNVLFRSGTSVAVSLEGTELVLDEEVDLGDGARGRLSDHDGVLVRLRLAEGASEHPHRRATAYDDADVLFDEDATFHATLRVTSFALGIAFVSIGVMLWRRARGRRRRDRLLAATLLATLVMTAGWFFYLGVVFTPTHDEWLATAKARVGKLRTR